MQMTFFIVLFIKKTAVNVKYIYALILVAILYLIKKYWGITGVLADNVFQLFRLGLYVIDQ